MSTLERLDRWKDQNAITAQQHALFTSLAREQPFSLFAELNILLYAGVLAFVAGLGWTVTSYSKQIGDVLIVTLLSVIVVASLLYGFRRAPAWSRRQTPPQSFLSDYVLYLCCLVWAIELAYLEQRLYLFPGHWDRYLLATAVLFFYLAYRFDNRLVLSLALSSLAGWFGFTIARLPAPNTTATYRQEALSFCLCVAIGTGLLRFLKIKPHFFATYLNLIANILLVTLLTGVFEPDSRGLWFLALAVASAASLTWGILRREFAFVAYAAVYTYIGLATLLLSGRDVSGLLALLIMLAAGMLFGLVIISRSFGRTQ